MITFLPGLWVWLNGLENSPLGLRASPRVPKTLPKNLVLGTNTKITAPTETQSNSQFFRTSKNSGIWSHISATTESSQSFHVLCWPHAFTYLSRQLHAPWNWATSRSLCRKACRREALRAGDRACWWQSHGEGENFSITNDAPLLTLYTGRIYHEWCSSAHRWIRMAEHLNYPYSYPLKT